MCLLVSWRINWNPHQCRLLSWLGNEGHPDRALEVFEWLDSSREYVTADRHLYTRLVSMFARQAGGLDMAMRIFDRMRAKGIRPDTVAFNSAITVAGEPCTHSPRPGLARLPPLSISQHGALFSADVLLGRRYGEAVLSFQDAVQERLATGRG